MNTVRPAEIIKKIDEETKKIPSIISSHIFTALQANIRRYGWQALVVRLTAITMASVFVLMGLGLKAHSPLTFRAWPLVIMFLFWILDGHSKFLQQKYVDLYHDAEGGVLPDLAFKIDDRFNVSSLWRPMVMTPYMLLIVILVLANLGF